ncbi:hypothetical protein PIB30_026683 [Stylosanthes scabra]|uniref:Uncharacterized protein n=1 Tax=Stylosanthes scabra TaxID=79078 RepID=A0ABU6QA38_9FABA|nr:hypothetical protein [Stylosanthes scabra]
MGVWKGSLKWCSSPLFIGVVRAWVLTHCTACAYAPLLKTGGRQIWKARRSRFFSDALKVADLSWRGLCPPPPVQFQPALSVAAMTTLVRNSTLSFSRKYRYESLGGRDNLVKSVSYRRRRAKQRQIFLTTYKLSSLDDDLAAAAVVDSNHDKKNKMKKVAVKVKKIVASVLMFMRTASFRSSCHNPRTSAAIADATSLPPNRKNLF